MRRNPAESGKRNFYQENVRYSTVICRREDLCKLHNSSSKQKQLYHKLDHNLCSTQDFKRGPAVGRGDYAVGGVDLVEEGVELVMVH